MSGPPTKARSFYGDPAAAAAAAAKPKAKPKPKARRAAPSESEREQAQARSIAEGDTEELLEGGAETDDVSAILAPSPLFFTPSHARRGWRIWRLPTEGAGLGWAGWLGWLAGLDGAGVTKGRRQRANNNNNNNKFCSQEQRAREKDTSRPQSPTYPRDLR